MASNSGYVSSHPQRSYEWATEAARRLPHDPAALLLHEPRGTNECAAAVATLAHEVATMGGTFKQIVDSSRAAAEMLSGERLQGLSEIEQNLDDASARQVRIHRIGNAIFAIHDGAPLTLLDVHALAFRG